MRNLLRAVAAAGVLGASVLVATASPTAAVEGEAIEVAPEHTASKDYDLTAPEPVASAAADTRETLYTPANCATGPTCTRIPILLELPGSASRLDDYFMNLKVEMGEFDDYDAMLWLEGSERPIATSATAPGMTETFNVQRSGEVRRYDLVVWNYTALEGFKVTVKVSKEAISTPFEALETPTAPAPSDDALKPPTEAPPEVVLPDLDALPSLAPVPAPDASLAFTAPPSAAELTTPPLDPTPNLAAARPDEPSGLVLAAWLIGLPVLVLAVAGWWLRRRRPTALRWA